MSLTVNTWIDTFQSFKGLLLSRCYGHVTWKTILADVLKQELAYGETKARTWSWEYQWKTGIIFTGVAISSNCIRIETLEQKVVTFFLYVSTKIIFVSN